MHQYAPVTCEVNKVTRSFMARLLYRRLQPTNFHVGSRFLLFQCFGIKAKPGCNISGVTKYSRVWVCDYQRPPWFDMAKKCQSCGIEIHVAICLKETTTLLPIFAHFCLGRGAKRHSRWYCLGICMNSWNKLLNHSQHNYLFGFIEQ